MLCFVADCLKLAGPLRLLDFHRTVVAVRVLLSISALLLAIKLLESDEISHLNCAPLNTAVVLLPQSVTEGLERNDTSRNCFHAINRLQS